jgi:hypothetical protein
MDLNQNNNNLSNSLSEINENTIDDLEAELAALEKEEQMIKEQEEKLKNLNSSKTLQQDNNSNLNKNKNENNSDMKIETIKVIEENTTSHEKLLSLQLRSAFQNNEFSDVTIVVEDVKKIPCHKIILSCRCEYFRKLFETNKAANQFHLKNAKYPVICGLIEYLYCGQISVSNEWLEELYFLCETYGLPDLQRLCEKKLANIFGPGTRSNSFARQSSGSTGDAFIPGETEKMRELRKKVANEIYETEKTYVKSLQFIFTDFITVLRSSTNKEPILTSEELNDIFSYWEVILKCHNSLLKSIEERINNWDNFPHLGDIFLNKIAFIKLYKHYVNNFDKSIAAIKQMKEKNIRFKEFLQNLEGTSKMNGLNLQAYLILPVQRIPRYVLLLKDILKNTVESHPDRKNLEDALQNMKELTDYINANKNDDIEINKILAIQDRIINWPSKQLLVKPRRRLVREGILYKPNKDKLQIFLFTDALLICKLKSKDKLKFKSLISLPTSSLIINSKPNDKYHFEIISQDGKTYLWASPEEKESWQKSIQDAIEKSQKDLLNTAFKGFEKKDSEGSKQFQKLQEEEELTKRSELAVQIKVSESDYLKILDTIIDIFYSPLNRAANGNYPIISHEDINQIFSVLPNLQKQHSDFYKSVENRVNVWDNSSTLGDLFLELIVNSLKLYSQYLENHPLAMNVIDKNMTKTQFATFIVETEKQHKISLNDLLRKPLERLAQYYLTLEELKQYTSTNHPDNEKLSVVIARLKEHLEQQKQQQIDTQKMKIKSLSRRNSSNAMSSKKSIEKNNLGSPLKSSSSMQTLKIRSQSVESTEYVKHKSFH